MAAGPSNLKMDTHCTCKTQCDHLARKRAQAMATVNDRKIATPPTLGIGVVCTCRSSAGLSNQPCARARLRTTRVNTSDSRIPMQQESTSKMVTGWPFSLLYLSANVSQNRWLHSDGRMQPEFREETPSIISRISYCLTPDGQWL